ncbi:MAG: hypothetical protein IPG98_07430 [Burkholderiales bacterium]|nr:hypothetical protein [Burkholderiales bacterium]
MPSPQPETASFPMRFLADHDVFVTLPESPAGRLKAETPGFPAFCAGLFKVLSAAYRRRR